ncbi:MAG: orotate phosphoribosyltransferase [Candidatus Omnitrophica bacterium]|nr:orotate phosphoribosyltransferase [Candidatus Omnitrophota bacterium]
MQDYQHEFIEFLVEIGALKFGEFTLKSGRKSPYFFNSATFDTGYSIKRLGYFYAAQIAQIDPRPSVVFGPAYKGIPLAVAAAISLNQDFGIDAGYCFDRKEAKAHGDKGLLVGNTPIEGDRIVMVDDVITDGGTKVEAVERLREITAAPVTDVVIALNRQEKTANGEDPIGKLESSLGLKVHAIATIDLVLESLEGKEMGGSVVMNEEISGRIRAYRKEYGV